MVSSLEGGLLAVDRLSADPVAFATAQPFPHVVLDDVLAVDRNALAAEFPADDWDGWHRYQDWYQVGKRIQSDITRIPTTLRLLIEEMSQPAFLEYLEVLTGIPSLLPDPHLEGGGLHASVTGSTLQPHTDFHIYQRLNLYRRLNVLLYLNPGWQPEWGGALELYADPEAPPVRSIDPVFGRMVVFQTDDDSPHGFTVPVAPGHYRRSIALYYYTSTEVEGYAGDTNTYWKLHGEGDAKHRVRVASYKTLLFASRGFSRLANWANPNLDAGLRGGRVDDD